MSRSTRIATKIPSNARSMLVAVTLTVTTLAIFGGVGVLPTVPSNVSQIDFPMGQSARLVLHLTIPRSPQIVDSSYTSHQRFDVAQPLSIASFVPARRQAPDTPAAQAGPRTVNHGPVDIIPRTGVVQHHPAITVLFWGVQWRRHHRVIAQLLAFYSRLRGSSYAAVTLQYNGAGNEPILVGAWIDPQPPTGPNGRRLSRVTVVDASIEVERVSRLTGLNLNPSSHVIVALPPHVVISWPNTAPNRFVLGGHGAVAPWPGNQPIGPSMGKYGTFTLLAWFPVPRTAGAEFTITASHEWAESVTDPNPLYHPGFIDLQTNSEIADVCQDVPPVVRAGITVTRIYSVRARACVAPSLRARPHGR